MILGCLCLATLSRQRRYTGYKPLVYINDRVYGEIGIVAKSPPEGFSLAGTVKEKVSSLDPMVERNFAANMLDVGTEILRAKITLTKSI